MIGVNCQATQARMSMVIQNSIANFGRDFPRWRAATGHESDIINNADSKTWIYINPRSNYWLTYIDQHCKSQ
jgi:hypothetical protein